MILHEPIKLDKDMKDKRFIYAIVAGKTSHSSKDRYSIGTVNIDKNTPLDL